MELQGYIEKHGFLKGTKEYMEINFLKEKSLEEINEIINTFSDKSDKLEAENKLLKEYNRKAVKIAKDGIARMQRYGEFQRYHKIKDELKELTTPKDGR